MVTHYLRLLTSGLSSLMTLGLSSLSATLLCAALLLSACSSNQTHQAAHAAPIYSAPITAILSGQSLLGVQVQPQELPNVDLLAITPEMAAFADKAASGKSEDMERVAALHMALLRPQSMGGRGITYTRYTTGTPIETFNSRQTNCLGYALLFRAMAKHLGLFAYINDVQVPPTWDMREDESMVFLRHVNVKVALRSARQILKFTDDVVVDLEMSLYKSYYTQQEISEAEITARYYSNRGLEFAQEKKLRQAFLYLRKAIEEDGQQSYVWNNFASLYFRANDLNNTEAIYLQALQANPKDLSVMNNLASLYTKMQRSDEAEYYRKLAEKHRAANPYYQYFNAYKSFNAGEYDEALTQIRHSIKIEAKEPRFYLLASQIYSKLGRVNEAETMQKRYKALAAPVSVSAQTL